MSSTIADDIAVTTHTRYRPLVVTALAACAGVSVDRLVVSPLGMPAFGPWWFASGFALVLSTALKRRGRDWSAAVILLLAVAGVFGAWSHVRWNYFPADDLSRFATNEPEAACIEIVLTEHVKHLPPPEETPLRAIPLGPMSEAAIRVVGIRDGRTWRKASGASRLRVAGELTGVAPGDRLRVFAKIGRPYPTLNPGQYDWAAAERGRGRFSEVYCSDPACVAPLSSAASTTAAWIGTARRWCQRQLAYYVGLRDEDLALAVLLGARERLTDSTTRAFLLTGTIHLLVISGLHVGMLAGFVWGGLRLCAVPRNVCIIVTVAVLAAYVVIAGPRPPVVRATLLIFLLMCATRVSRRPSGQQLLAAAALVVLAVNPSEIFRGGTQLSFLSVAVLARWRASGTLDRREGEAPVPDPLDALIAKTAPWHVKIISGIWDRWKLLTRISIALWLLCAPSVAYHFHIATPGGVLVSPLIWPLIAVAISSGAGILAIGWACPLVGAALGYLCAASLQLSQQIVELAHNFDFTYFYCAGPAQWWVAIFYGCTGIFATQNIRRNFRWIGTALALWIAVGLFAASRQRLADDELRCTFLAMGHGTCAVVELPGGQTLLYDAGSLGSPEGASRAIASFLWSRGISHIDAIVLSHADVDHYNAVPGLLERFSTGVVYVSPMMFDPLATDGQLSAPHYLRDAVAERGVFMREIWMNDRLEVADERVEITVLHPPRIGVMGRDNANSLLLAIEYAGHRILLPGDLESPGLEAVTADPPLDVDILLAPHHGSAGSDPPGFAAWCTPEWVVVSGRSRRRTGVANRSYKEAGAQVLHTSEAGAAQFVITPAAIRASTYQ